ncbi:fatty acid desaturase family protein [Pontibacter vulgaris]|uniref:fatty acid desaturase family protein n=1 Tax=Pontibacter vulgaris TaxID=2905679 RepID=UPI001FA7DA1F|nr:acyl-CoA desaturase [Pontibacter vulgaris]
MAAPKFSKPSNSFHSELKSRINAYFTEAGKSPNGNYKLYTKAVILWVSLVLVYVHLLFFTPVAWVAIIESIILGGLTASIGFNVMHDGSHGSFSKYKWLNELAGLSINVLGANVFMWNTKHNVIHHAYTNIDGIDDDLDAKPLLRLCETQKHYKIHRFQHWYFWAAYATLYLYWVFFTDYNKYFTKRVGSMPLKPMKLNNHLVFWSFKALHAVLFVGLPIFMVGFLPWLIGFLIYSFATGFVMSIVFQLAHTVEDTQFLAASETAVKVEDEWAVHQLKTTANFATNNKIISWLVGGLNFQIEHHLFPKVSHIHYPAISKIIKQACADYGINYIEYPKMRMAVASHVSHLRQLAKPQ